MSRRGVEDGLPPFLTRMLIRWALHTRAQERSHGYPPCPLGKLDGAHGRSTGRPQPAGELPEDVAQADRVISRDLDETERRVLAIYYGFYADAEVKAGCMLISDDTMRRRVLRARAHVYRELRPYIHAHPLHLEAELSETRAHARRNLIPLVAASLA